MKGVIAAATGYGLGQNEGESKDETEIQEEGESNIQKEA